MSQPNRRRRYRHLYYNVFRNPDDTNFGILRMYLPTGGLLTCIPLKVNAWEDEVKRELVFDIAIKLDDVVVSRNEWAKLVELARSLMKQTVGEHSSMVSELLLCDFEPVDTSLPR